MYSKKFKPCSHTGESPILRSNGLKKQLGETPVLYGIRDHWVYRGGVCKGTEFLKEPFLFSAGRTALERHACCWQYGRMKGDKLVRVQKRMKERSKKTIDLGNKFEEFSLFGLSKKNILARCIVVC